MATKSQKPTIEKSVLKKPDGRKNNGGARPGTGGAMPGAGRLGFEPTDADGAPLEFAKIERVVVK